MAERTRAAVRRLRDVLDRIGDGLVGFDLDELLAAESALHSALADLQRVEVGDDEREAVRADIVAASRALGRCERLGDTLDEMTRISVAARNARLGLGYDRTGRERGPATSTPSLDARV